MGKPSIEEVKQKIDSWDFVDSLPSTIGNFIKVKKGDISGQIITLCTYVNEPLKAKIGLIYSHETQDYILTQHMGLNYYRDVRFIYREEDIFASKVKEALPGIVNLMENPKARNLGEMVEEKGILNWEYGNSLPEKIGDFERYIKPMEAIEHLNGSIIFLDYSNFAKSDQVVFYYNRLRDQFFAEFKIGGVFSNTKDFDCNSLKTLEEKIKKHLERSIEYVSNEDHSL